MLTASYGCMKEWGKSLILTLSFSTSLLSSRSLWQNQLVALNLHQERKTGMKTKMIEQFNCTAEVTRLCELFFNIPVRAYHSVFALLSLSYEQWCPRKCRTSNTSINILTVKTLTIVLFGLGVTWYVNMQVFLWG